MTGDRASNAATVGEWLRGLSPPPPPALARRLESSLERHLSRPVAELPEACILAGEDLLAQLLESGSTSRDTALDLLAVDALVTYAFEAAAGHPAGIEERAALAMQRIAAFPAPPESPA
jgi:hypothetical protein